MTQAFETWLRRLPLPLLTGLLMLFGGCAGSGGSGGGDTLVTVSVGSPGGSARAAAQRQAAAVPSSVRSLHLTVSGPGMSDVAASAVVTGEGPVSLTVAVPPGPERVFVAVALDGAGVERYRGSSTADVAGERLDVAIRMGAAPTNPAPARWHWRNPVPTGADLSAVAYGEGTFVAVGDAGTVLTSADGGATWVSRFPGTTQALWGVAYGEGVFVAVGDLGGVFVSGDRGVTWVQAYLAGASLADVTYGDGRFLAVGSGPMALSSADGGATWVPLDQDLPAGAYPEALAFGDGQFHLLADVNAFESSAVFRSADGVTWTDTDLRVAYGSRGLAYGNGMLLVADLFGQIVVATVGAGPVSYYITDGTDLFRATFGGGEFFVVGDGGFVSASADPVTVLNRLWTDRPSVTSAPLAGCAYGDGALVAVGAGGAVVTYAGEAGQSRWSSLFPASADGGVASTVSAVGFGGGVFVASADGIFRSADGGVTWQGTQTPGDLVPLLDAFAYGAGTFLGVGSSGAFSSVDFGQTWSDASLGDVASPEAAAYGGGVFQVVNGSQEVLRGAPPGAGAGWSWTSEALPPGTFAHGVAYGGGTWVAVGARFPQGQEAVLATVAASSDEGQTWATAADLGFGTLRWVVFGDQAFVAVDAGGRSYSSADGLTWSPAGTIPLQDSNVSGLAYGGGVLLAIDSQGFLYTSLDGGGEWVQTGFRSPYPLRSATFGAGTFLAGGDLGAVLQSEPL